MSARTDYARILRDRYAQAADDAAGISPVGLTEWRAIRGREDWRRRYAIHAAGIAPRDADALTARDWLRAVMLAAGFLAASVWIGATGG